VVGIIVSLRWLGEEEARAWKEEDKGVAEDG